MVLGIGIALRAPGLGIDLKQNPGFPSSAPLKAAGPESGGKAGWAVTTVKQGNAQAGETPERPSAGEQRTGDATPARREAEASPANTGLAAHILPTSATMIGVCMTVLSIGHLAPRGTVHEFIDKLLAFDALVFLASALLSFMSMRSRHVRSPHEARAETVFVTGLGILALGAIVLAFAIT